MVDLTQFLATGVNDPADQISLTKWNLLLSTVEAGINSAGGTIDPNQLPYVTPEQYGAVADFVTDDTAAFELAEAAASTQGKFVWLKSKKYYLSNGFNAHKSVYWLGSGGNAALAGGGTIIRVGKNVNGWVANYGSTHGDGLGTQGTAEGGKIEGIAFYGGNVNVNGAGVITTFAAGDSQTGHGIRIRTPFYGISDVLCAFFGGDALNINCSNGGAASVTGNANNFTVDRFQGIYCGGAATLTNGLDANSGSITNSSAISCSGGGFIEYAFLENKYFNLHVRACGIETNILGYDAPTGTCTYGGATYRVMPGKEVQAATTVPGTDSTVWAETGVAFSNRPWTAGKTWAIGAPFAMNPANTNNRTIVIGLYTEDDMMPPACMLPGMVLGGLFGQDGLEGTGTYVFGSAGGGLQTNELRSVGANATNTFGSSTGNTIVHHQGGASTVEWRRNDSYFAKRGMDLFIDNAYPAMHIGLESTGPYGNGGIAIGKLYIGDGTVNTAKLVTYGAAAPTTGAHVVGEIVFNLNPTAGGKIGWVCTVAGTPGTWKQWGVIDA